MATHTVELQPGRRARIRIELTPEEMERGLDRAARRLAQRVRIPGFRPGRVPRRLLEARFGREALVEEALDDLIERAYRQVLEAEEDLTPFAPASVEEIEQADPLIVVLDVPLTPVASLPDDYAEQLKIEVPELETTEEEDLEAFLQDLREGKAVFEAVERPAREGDWLLANVEVVDPESGEVVHRDEELELEVGSERLLPELQEGLVGVEAEEVREIDVELPEDSALEALAGRTARFRVQVLEVRERKLPELDEELAKELGFESLQELREKALEEVRERREEELRNRALERALERLTEIAEVEYPVEMVEEELDGRIRTVDQALRRQGTTLEEALQREGKTVEAYREEMREAAEEAVKRFLALRAFREREGLEAEEEEIDLFLSAQFGVRPEVLRESGLASLLEHEGMRADAGGRIVTDKAYVRLLEIATEGQVRYRTQLEALAESLEAQEQARAEAAAKAAAEVGAQLAEGAAEEAAEGEAEEAVEAPAREEETAPEAEALAEEGASGEEAKAEEA